MRYKLQDVAITVGSIVFVMALIPTILDPHSFVPRSTSILTAVFLCVDAVAFLSLKLRLSGISTLITGIMWWIIFIWRGGP